MVSVSVQLVIMTTTALTHDGGQKNTWIYAEKRKDLRSLCFIKPTLEVNNLLLKIITEFSQRTQKIWPVL